MQQRGTGLQGVGILAVQDVGPVEAQRPVVGPLVAVQQQPFVQPQQQHVARRGVGTKHGVRQQVGPGLAFHVGRQWLAAVVEGGQLVVQQVVLLAAGLVGRDDGQPVGLARARGMAQQLPHRQRQAGHQLLQGGAARRGLVAQRLQQAGLQLHEGVPALVGLLAAQHLAAQAKPALRPGLQALLRRAVGFVARVLRLAGVPGVQAGLDIALEHFSQVVVAVELVFVADASEGLYGFQYGHGQAPIACSWPWGWHTAASTWIQGWGSVVRVSCTHWRYWSKTWLICWLRCS